jgi:hypothetical protein
MLEPLVALYGGGITLDDNCYKWYTTNPDVIMNLYSNYFSIYPSQSSKAVRIDLLPLFFE